MASLEKIEDLQVVLSAGAEMLLDPSTASFEEHMQRWTNLRHQTPAAIVLCATESDATNAVKWAVGNSVPFVPKSGGHSQYSTIGSEGIVIDLSRMSGVSVDVDKGTATLKGGVLEKDVAIALAALGRWTPAPNANAVGAIPYFLNGGTNATSPLVGYASDQIVSARVVTAKGEVVCVDDQTHPDLLWALRGAGQYFGLVTELTVRTFPFSLLGNEQGVIWSGMFVFPFDRAEEVGEAMAKIIDDPTYQTGGLLMAACPPPAFQPVVMVSGKFVGEPDRAAEAYKLLYELKPIKALGGPVPVANLHDSLDVFCGKGDFKRFSIVGVPGFDKLAWLETLGIWKSLQAACPDARATTFNFQWHSQPPAPAAFSSACNLHDVRVWQNNFIWYKDPASHAVVDQHDNKCLAVMRGTTDESQFVDFPNGVRTNPIQARYRGVEHLARLRSVKKEWDPAGVFTRELL